MHSFTRMQRNSCSRDLMQAARAFERTTIGAFCIDIADAVAIERFLSLPVY